MAKHNDLGKFGELVASKFLVKKGYLIKETNWRFGRNEIDLIAESKDMLVFAEVKTRSSYLWGMPEAFLTEAQTKRLVETANNYIDIYSIKKQVRFDVFSIVVENTDYILKHFEDAILP